jgi:hypothetical protein
VRSGKPTQCYVDESIQLESGFVVSAFVFANGRFDRKVASALRAAGLVPGKDEFKSGARMDANPSMRKARGSLLKLAGSETQVAVFVGPHEPGILGKHSLQALQSILVRNGIRPSDLTIFFDEGMFPSVREAARLHSLFHFLKPARLLPSENSRIRLGVQVADAVAHSWGQIVKEAVTGKAKMIDIGGRGTGYAKGQMAPLGWDLLMTLRYALLTRPMTQNGEEYFPATDPVVLDPMSDDPVTYGQNPTLLGWGRAGGTGSGRRAATCCGAGTRPSLAGLHPLATHTDDLPSARFVRWVLGRCPSSPRREPARPFARILDENVQRGYLREPPSAASPCRSSRLQGVPLEQRFDARSGATHSGREAPPCVRTELVPDPALELAGVPVETF